jgi:putative FmdB family regulatory protein
MPMYEYQCSKCEARFEELVTSPEDEAEIKCSSCGSTKVFKVMSTFSSHCGDSSNARGSSCSSARGFKTGFS